MLVLKDEVRTARKFYDCDASEMWRSYGPPREAVTADERLVLEGVEADKWKIRPGQRYRCAWHGAGQQSTLYASVPISCSHMRFGQGQACAFELCLQLRPLLGKCQAQRAAWQASQVLRNSWRQVKLCQS